MEQELIKIFREAKYKVEPDLKENIWHAIVVRNKRLAKLKSWIFSLVGFASLGGLVPAFKILLNDLTQSGFYEYLSLIFSNSGSIVSYWKEFTFSLAESLPTMSIIFTLSLVFVFFLSLRYAARQIGNFARLDNNLSRSQLSLSI